MSEPILHHKDCNIHLNELYALFWNNAPGAYNCFDKVVYECDCGHSFLCECEVCTHKPKSTKPEDVLYLSKDYFD